MSTALEPRDLVIAYDPCGHIESSPRIAGAVRRGGGIGVLDLADGSARPMRALDQLVAWSAEPVAVRVPANCLASLDQVEQVTGGQIDLVVVTGELPWRLDQLVARYRVLAEVTSLTAARAAVGAGVHGLIARGMESGGEVGELSTFILVQQLVAADLGVPVWALGGIGPHTAAACVAGGAAGVVLDTQLALMPESDLPTDVMATIRRMDGSEAVLVDGFRGVARTPRRPGTTGTPPRADLLPVGQDGWLAAEFRRRWADSAAAVRGLRAAIVEAVTDGTAADVLRPDGPLARALGLRVPVAQGPMTRVSDEAGFAAAVAADGALPFIALALATAERTEEMLTATAARLGDRPWGVGVLGFAPDDIRTAQLEVIRRVRPGFAIIAGGRPPQAKELEREGIRTFLHVPSPGLLRQFLRSGARRFIFEGAECGGHVGPRASFPLWEAQLAVLAEHVDAVPAEQAADLQVFFAGGIHDDRSAAMVAAMAAPLTRRGVQVGVLMGTAYLFTNEAVDHGAIRPAFSRMARSATRTALLETAPGHVTRCLHSDFVDDFHALRVELESAGLANRQIWEHLELLNVGRLRIASKGKKRDGDALVDVDEATQLSEGLFMAGQVAVLRDSETTVAELHRTVTDQAAAFHQSRAGALRDAWAAPAQEQDAAPLDIAVVGMACMLPNSPDLAAFWRTVLDSVDAVTEVPPHRWNPDIYYAPEVGPGQTGRISVSKWGGFLAEVPFDAIAYGIPPAALASIDPTQLLALEVSHRALVDAGYTPGRDGVDHSRTGVIFGAEAGSDMGHAQTLRTMLPAYLADVPAELADQLPTVTEDSFPGILANVIAGRVANRLDLGGPNYTVDAACASSLAAMDAACKELASGGSDLMICGGADLHNGINDYLMFTSAHALSPTGRCRSFDSTGDGIALGEGVAAVVLKRLSDAERDGDRIYAVIKGLGGSSDGRALGLTAPRADGQRRALDRAYRQAGVSPAQVGLIEAHGTGTVVGDRTELETLTTVFNEAGAAPGSCTLGSVKSQIGHTKCVAGLAGLIKASLALYTGVRPPTLHLTRPNPAWHPDHSPFAFYTQARPWATPAAERIAGVSAFGFGGTNFHAVLAAYPNAPEPRHARDDWPAELFCFRAGDRAGAQPGIRQLLATIDTRDAMGRRWRLRDLAAAQSRECETRSGPVQVAVVASDLDELAGLLRRALDGDHDPASGLHQPAATHTGGKVAFLFPGQGSQRPGALADLFVAFPELRRFLDLGRDLAGPLFPPAAFDPDGDRGQQERVRDTRVAQPVLGIGGLAMHHLLGRVNVRPDLAGGHSYGELVALCVAGAFDDRTLLALSRQRAEAILAAAGTDPGTMAAVAATADRISEVLSAAGLSDEVVLANHNGPQQVVISGPTSAVRQAVTALKAGGVSARPIPVACAFHSPVVAGGVPAFRSVLAGHRVAAPAFPVWSNRTADSYPTNPEAVRDELAGQIAAPVRFVDEIESMYAAGARIFVEAGPGKVLSRLVDAVLGDRPHLAVAVEGRRTGGLRGFLSTLAELACAGVPVQTDWLFRGRRIAEVTASASSSRPIWTVDGQLVRDQHGRPLPGGMTPPRQIKELSMTASTEAGNGHAHGNVSGDGNGNGVTHVAGNGNGNGVTHVAGNGNGNGVAHVADNGNGISHPLGAGDGVRHVAGAMAGYRDGRDELISEFLRTSRDLIASQRDVLLAYFGERPAAGNGWVEPAAYQSMVAQPAIAAPSRYPEVVVPPSAPPVTDVPDVPAIPASPAVSSAPPAPAVRSAPPAPAVQPAAVPRAEVAAVTTVHGSAVPAVAAKPVAAPTGLVSTAATVTATVAVRPSVPSVEVAQFQEAILAVLSERTGYPVDLIELDLDLEADLSIDSIKRAEVAGEVATRLRLSVDGDESELEDLVRARTVRTMVAWLAEKMAAAPTAVASPAPVTAPDPAPVVTAPVVTAPAVSVPTPTPAAAPVPASVPSVEVAQFQEAILAVLSERTGYPVDLIELDLDLEADLSIDSIKRAEVAGEVATRLRLSVDGDESELEDLVRARTVRTMVAWLAEKMAAAPTAVASPAPVTAPDPAPVVTAPAVSAPTPTPAAAPVPASVPSVEVAQFQEAILAVLSERTGYPVDLIELDLDLEADLSIDSIKRAEVAGEVATRLRLSVDGDESELEDLVRARTVRTMVAWLAEKMAADQAPEAAPAASAAVPAGPDRGTAPRRLVARPVPATGAVVAPEALAGARFLITGGSPALAPLAEQLAQRGAAGATGSIHAGGADQVAGYDGVIILDGLSDSGGPLLPGIFPFIKQALAAGVRWLVAAGTAGPRTDGFAGLFRTISREYPQVSATYLEVPAGADHSRLATGLVTELLSGGQTPIVTWSTTGRQTVDLTSVDLGPLAAGGAGPAGDGAAEAQAIGLDQDSVVVLVGGARGITPWFARTLAAASRCRIELVGRTPLPEETEPPALAAAADKPALRAALVAQGMRAPAEIDRAATAILAAREVRATLDELRELGSQVRYHSLDVTDADATRQLLKEIQGERGRIDGLVYAAGRIEDKLIAEKDPASFDRVFQTKVQGAVTVLDALRDGADPRFVVLFGSIAAAYGNRGQSDYAAANDALDRIGGRWAADTGVRCLTVHWGPWAPGSVHGGMVSAELSREYARRGIDLIDPEEGALSLLRELAWGDPAVTSVVYTASGW
ncbi:SDR family NAD(P)-dependent oxidoreductase [Solwaraspora sp. WMMD791]|uniref:type I polyketide synthase n=1 Tax=Solwaraspora sp. WMMD791 TaxID=3016086 RepID=UPI00249BD580|nr:type I polyketide synthase [Solwaraspora sp. WMMD791]WFE28025.1 SDR family NAD(P)-dependent oxidoreductase [Solwaraspora sp. WMMD791]